MSTTPRPPAAGCRRPENRVARFVENNGVGSNPTTIFTSPQTRRQPQRRQHPLRPRRQALHHHRRQRQRRQRAGRDRQERQDAPHQPRRHHPRRQSRSSPRPARCPRSTPWACATASTSPSTRSLPRPHLRQRERPRLRRRDEPHRGGLQLRLAGQLPLRRRQPQPATYNTIPPLWYLPAGQCCDAPTGITVYTGHQIPQWHNELFMAAYNNGDAAPLLPQRRPHPGHADQYRAGHKRAIATSKPGRMARSGSSRKALTQIR